MHQQEGKWHITARNVAILVEECCFELNALHDAAVAAVNAVLPMGPNLEESLHTLPTWVIEVDIHGIYHGASTALAAA